MKRLGFLALLAACSRPAPAPPAADSSTAAAPVAATPAAPADTTEAGRLAGSGGRASRTGLRLTITPDSAPAVVLADDSTEGDDYKSYRYLGPVAGVPFHLVRVGYYEGGAYLLVHARTGKQRLVDGAPVASPDGMRIAIANMDLEAAMEANKVEVFRIERDSLVSEWFIEPTEWGPDSLAWRAPDVLALTKLWRNHAGDYQPERATVTHRGAGWLIDPVDRPKRP